VTWSDQEARGEPFPQRLHHSRARSRPRCRACASRSYLPAEWAVLVITDHITSTHRRRSWRHAEAAKKAPVVPGPFSIPCQIAVAPAIASVTLTMAFPMASSSAIRVPM
jgi:hypothetical protein